MIDLIKADLIEAEAAAWEGCECGRDDVSHAGLVIHESARPGVPIAINACTSVRCVCGRPCTRNSAMRPF